MPNPTPWTDITQEDDWAYTPFIVAIFEAWNERREMMREAPVLVPDYDGADITDGTGNVPLPENTSITRSGTTATASYSATPQAKVGDTVVISGATQPEYNGEHVVTSVQTSPFLGVQFAVSGSPATPATGTPKFWNKQRMRFSLAAIQVWMESHVSASATRAFGDRDRTVAGSTHGGSGGDYFQLQYSLARWRAAAGLHASGFRRKKPREITSTSATTDTNGNARATGQRAFLTTGTNNGMVHEFDGAAWVCSNTSKSVTSLTRSGTTATATITAHGYPSGATVIIAGAVPTGYNGTHTITVVNANTFTFTVIGTLTTPATGTITSKRQIIEPVNVLDSAAAAPNNVPYGQHQASDYITSIMCNEIRAGMRKMIEVVQPMTHVSSRSRSGTGQVWDDMAAAQAAATAQYNGTESSNPGWQNAVSRINTTNASDPTDLNQLAQASRAYHGIGRASNMYAVNKSVDVYAWSYLPQHNAGSSLPKVYDDHGDGLVEDEWNIIETLSTSSDTVDSTPFGQSTIPSFPGVEDEYHGYEIAGWFVAVIRYDDGLQYT